MSRLYFLVGLPASGKSTWADNFALLDDNKVHLSSDNLRLELYGDETNQEHNGEVFAEMNRRTKENLKKGNDVIYNATNISSKRRMAFLNEIKNISCEKICIYFAIHPNECTKLDSIRTRQVGKDVIHRMYRNMNIPMYHEGWDKIRIIGFRSDDYKFDINSIQSYEDFEVVLNNPITEKCIGFAQDNPHHTFSVSRHMYHVFKYINENSENKYLKIGAMLHDIGKPYCKRFNEGSKYANFYQHENVSSQLAILFLLHCGFDNKEIIKIATYAQLHMKLLNVGLSYKGKEKLLKQVGTELFEELELLRNADSQAK